MAEKHQMKITIDERDGLMTQIVCVDHAQDGCGYAEAFYWDPASSMESVQEHDHTEGNGKDA